MGKSRSPTQARRGACIPSTCCTECSSFHRQDLAPGTGTVSVFNTHLETARVQPCLSNDSKGYLHYCGHPKSSVGRWREEKKNVSVIDTTPGKASVWQQSHANLLALISGYFRDLELVTHRDDGVSGSLPTADDWKKTLSMIKYIFKETDLMFFNITLSIM